MVNDWLPSIFVQDLQLGCNCPDSMCYPESCSHIFLFDADHMNAKDATGNSMHCRCAYDKKGRIVLEVMYLSGCLSFISPIDLH